MYNKNDVIKMGESIFRVLVTKVATVTGLPEYFCIDCKKKTMPKWFSASDLELSSLCSEEESQIVLGNPKTSLEDLSAEEKKTAHPPIRDDLNRPLDKDGKPTKNPDEMIFCNPHAHIMMTCRPIDNKGKWEKKTQIEYLCKKGDEIKAFTASEFKKAKAQGWQKQYKYRDPLTSKTAWFTQEEAGEHGLDNSNRTNRQPKTTPYGRKNPITEQWSDSARVTEWRQSWEDICNQHLREAGISARMFFVKHFYLKKASEFPVFIQGISLLSAGIDYASRRMRACSIR